VSTGTACAVTFIRRSTLPHTAAYTSPHAARQCDIATVSMKRISCVVPENDHRPCVILGDLQSPNLLGSSSLMSWRHRYVAEAQQAVLIVVWIWSCDFVQQKEPVGTRDYINPNHVLSC